MEKARGIACDGIVFDLEDAVAPEAKVGARKHIRSALRAGGYGHRELVVRINGHGTPWWDDDVRFVAGSKVNAILIPKVESTTDIDRVGGCPLHSGWKECVDLDHAGNGACDPVR